jgi:BirA family biotin operon repressor/biotin-[acetyl-CoA-carboxylase] ligase
MIALPPEVAELGVAFRHVAELGSTNDAALDAVAEGAHRIWIVADRQLHGRGRQGRHWHSAPGNLYATLGMRFEGCLSEAPRLGFVAGVALARALRSLAPPEQAGRILLKWPNDVLVDGRKLAGILLEARKLAEGAHALALGFGVNLGNSPPDVGVPVIALNEWAGEVPRERAFAALAQGLARELARLEAPGGFSAIRAGWLEMALPIGTPIRLRLASGERSGRFAGLDPEGALLIDTEGERSRIVAGEVLLDREKLRAGAA